MKQQTEILRVVDYRAKTTTYWLSEAYLLRKLKHLTKRYLDEDARPAYLASVTSSKRERDVMPDTGRAWRFARWNGQFYYCWDNIPEKRREAMGDKVEELYNAVESGETKTYIQQLGERLLEMTEERMDRFIDAYLGYKTEQTLALARAAALLDAMMEVGTEAGLWSRKQYALLHDMLAACGTTKGLSSQYLPGNWRRVLDKVKECQSGKSITEVIDLPRRDNQNSRKFEDMVIEGWVIQLRGMGLNFTSAYIERKVMQVCDLTGRNKPSDSWMAELMARPEVKFQTAAGRYGERGRGGALYRGYTPAATAIFASDCWQFDGTRANMIPWKNAQTGREEFLYMVVVRDHHSGVVLGGYFGLAEDRHAYITAFRRAVEKAGHLPYEAVFDRFPGHNTDDWAYVEKCVRNYGVKVSYKHTATGKAQLERWYGVLQDVFFQKSPYYYGQGIQSRRDAAHRSSEYIKAVRKTARQDGWGLDMAMQEVALLVQQYNDTPLNNYSRKHRMVSESPQNLWDKSEKPHLKVIRKEEVALVFGLRKTLQMRNALIRTEIQGVEYLYRVADYMIASRHEYLLCAWNADDFTKVYLFEAGDKTTMPRYLGEAQQLSRVLVTGPDADYGALAKDRAILRSLKEQAKAEYDSHCERANDVALLLNGSGSKAEAEAAETGWLMERMRELPEPVPVVVSNEAANTFDTELTEDFLRDFLYENMKAG